MYAYLIIVSIAFSIPIVAAIFFFAVKYRQTEKYETPDEMHGSIMLETVWSIIPFVVSMTIFLGGAYVFYNQFRIPDDRRWKFMLSENSGCGNSNIVPVNARSTSCTFR